MITDPPPEFLRELVWRLPRLLREPARGSGGGRRAGSAEAAEAVARVTSLLAGRAGWPRGLAARLCRLLGPARTRTAVQLRRALADALFDGALGQFDAAVEERGLPYHRARGRRVAPAPAELLHLLADACLLEAAGAGALGELSGGKGAWHGTRDGPPGAGGLARAAELFLFAERLTPGRDGVAFYRLLVADLCAGTIDVERWRGLAESTASSACLVGALLRLAQGTGAADPARGLEFAELACKWRPYSRYAAYYVARLAAAAGDTVRTERALDQWLLALRRPVESPAAARFIRQMLALDRSHWHAFAAGRPAHARLLVQRDLEIAPAWTTSRRLGAGGPVDSPAHASGGELSPGGAAGPDSC